MLLFVLLICRWVCTGDAPAKHGTYFHGVLLCGCNAKAFVVVIGQLTVLRGIVCVPITGIVAALASFDTDESTGAGKGGETQLRQPLCQLWRKAFLLRLDTPIVGVPEMDIQLTSAIHKNFTLFKVLTPAISSLTESQA